MQIPPLTPRVTNTCLSTREKPGWKQLSTRSLAFCFCAQREKLEECAKQRQKPQVPGRPLQLKTKKQQCTCVSKLMLTGLSERRKKLLLLQRRNNATNISGICKTLFSSFLWRTVPLVFILSLGKVNVFSHLKASHNWKVCLLCSYSWAGAERA